MDQTREHIRLLSIFHYVLGGLTYLISLFPIFHLIMGIFFLVIDPSELEPSQPPAIEAEVIPSDSIRAAAEPAPAPGDPHARSTDLEDPIFMFRLIGGVFTFVAGLIILCGFALATAMIVAGRRLSQHRSHTFCLVVAGIECLLFPLHTTLGVFTFILLLKPEGRELFGATIESKAIGK